MSFKHFKVTVGKVVQYVCCLVHCCFKNVNSLIEIKFIGLKLMFKTMLLKADLEIVKQGVRMSGLVLEQPLPV